MALGHASPCLTTGSIHQTADQVVFVGVDDVHFDELARLESMTIVDAHDAIDFGSIGPGTRNRPLLVHLVDEQYRSSDHHLLDLHDEGADDDLRQDFAYTVILLTDGENDDPGSLSLQELVNTLERERDPARPVAVIAIGMGPEADAQALRRIAAATGGRSYVAREPADIGQVFVDAMLSR